MSLFKTKEQKYEEILEELETLSTKFTCTISRLVELKASGENPEEFSKLRAGLKDIAQRMILLRLHRNEYLSPEAILATESNVDRLKNGELTIREAYGTHAGVDYQYWYDLNRVPPE